MARNKHPEQTVQLILDTASTLFLQKGYDKTTLQDIIDATKLSKGAIYHHFASKEAIIIAVVDRIGECNTAVLAEVRDKKGLTGAEKLREMFRTAVRLSFQGGILNMLPFLIENPKFMALQMESILNEAAPCYVLPILREGIADGSIRADYPEQLAEVLLLMTDLWLHPVLRPSTPEQVRARCAFFNQFTRQYGFELLDEDLIDTLVGFCRS
ncbi:TetR/AcrR family transcriptional regulator [Lawsonibacter sp. JLR.KK007]|uniref:TetR/AcrR family transcriptional regulator n=1 Tax=Lawsonibacter sp. JLR.KK007 TaxID=3114293 RepID=UPI002FF2AF3D